MCAFFSAFAYSYGMGCILTSGFWTLWILLFLIGYGLFILQFEFRVDYQKTPQQDCLTVKVFMWRYCIFKKNFYHLESCFLNRVKTRNLSRASSQEKTAKGTWKDQIRQSFRQRLLKKPSLQQGSALLKTLRIRRIWSMVRIGTENAALTATICGFLYAFCGFLQFAVQQSAGLSQRPLFSIKPDFSKEGLEIYFQCIISFTIGNLINILRKIITHAK